MYRPQLSPAISEHEINMSLKLFRELIQRYGLEKGYFAEIKKPNGIVVKFNIQHCREIDTDSENAFYSFIDYLVAKYPSLSTKTNMLNAVVEWADVLVTFIITPELISELQQSLNPETCSAPQAESAPSPLLYAHKQEEQHRESQLSYRTHLMEAKNPAVKDHYAFLIDTHYPCVTGKVRNFNQQLCSAGSAKAREYLLVDPKSPVLNSYYEQFRALLKRTDNLHVVISKLCKYTRSVLPDSRINKIIAIARQQADSRGLNYIRLDQVLTSGQGVCRHHALFNSYVLSRLNEERIIAARIIHHRQNLTMQRVAHTWNVLKDTQTGTWYSLDSLNNRIINISINAKAMDKCYGESGVAELVITRHIETEHRLRMDIEQHKTQLLDTINAKIKSQDWASLTLLTEQQDLLKECERCMDVDIGHSQRLLSILNQQVMPTHQPSSSPSSGNPVSMFGRRNGSNPSQGPLSPSQDSQALEYFPYDPKS